VTDPIFVVSQVEIYRGADAERKLAERNDRAYADENNAILRVPDARWADAQVYERETWMKYNLGARVDRNGVHAAAFGHYEALPRDLGNVIEVGCGPFTNLVFILEGRTAKSVTLLDPLITIYQQHPNCTYADGTLNGYDVTTVESKLEDFKPRTRFDTLVCVNVLSHCQDADAALAAVKGALKKGGLLVFHEAPRVIDPERHFDMGHPLAYDADYLNAFLEGFEELYREGDYFIGRKK